MFQVTKNNLKMVRGDTGKVELTLTLEDGSIHTIGYHSFVVLADVTRE